MKLSNLQHHINSSTCNKAATKAYESSPVMMIVSVDNLAVTAETVSDHEDFNTNIPTMHQDEEPVEQRASNIGTKAEAVQSMRFGD